MIQVRKRARRDERSAQAGIAAQAEAVFQRAEIHAGLDDFEHALRWLAKGEKLCGGLSPGYLEKRARWRASLTSQRLS